MINAQRYLKNSSIPTVKLITCPACDKKRFRREINSDGEFPPASQETVEVRGETRFLEVCEHCIDKYRKADEKFMIETMRKLSSASRVAKENDNDSDHTDFSLN